MDTTTFWTWDFWQQVIRYVMAWGGTYLAASGMPEDMVTATVGAGVALAGAVWWFIKFRGAQPPE